MDWAPYITVSKKLIIQLAFSHNENNSLLILARSKQIIHSLISRVIQDEEHKRHQLDQTLKVVRVNTTLLDANE